MIRERFQNVRKQLVAIDDDLYGAMCEFEASDQPEPTRKAITAIVTRLRALLDILLRVIDSLP